MLIKREMQELANRKEYVKVFKEEGYKVIASHIDEGKNFFFYEPEEDYKKVQADLFGIIESQLDFLII